MLRPKRRKDEMPREPGDPGPHLVFDAMEPGVPYTVGELCDEFDTSRWTIERRLEILVDENYVRVKHHSPRRKSYWVPKE